MFNEIDTIPSPHNGEGLKTPYNETLKLFNTTFNKKKGAPKKVTIIDPQEFKKPEKYTEIINAGNKMDCRRGYGSRAITGRDFSSV